MFLVCILCHNLSLEVLCLCALFENHGVLHTLTSVISTLAWEAVFGNHSGFCLPLDIELSLFLIIPLFQSKAFFFFDNYFFFFFL